MFLIIFISNGSLNFRALFMSIFSPFPDREKQNSSNKTKAHLSLMMFLVYNSQKNSHFTYSKIHTSQVCISFDIRKPLCIQYPYQYVRFSIHFRKFPCAPPQSLPFPKYNHFFFSFPSPLPPQPRPALLFQNSTHMAPHSMRSSVNGICTTNF